MSDTQTNTSDAATILQNAITSTKQGSDVHPSFSEVQHAQNYEDALVAVRRLETEITSNGLAREAMQKQVSKLRRQLTHIDNALLQEAERREWCEEYSEWVDEVNGALGESLLTKPTKEISVEIRLSVTVKSDSGMSEDSIENELSEAVADHLTCMDFGDFEVVDV
jgi:hypothetical protein